VDLQPGEKVIYEGHPSWRAILGFYAKGALIGAVLGAIAYVAKDTGTGVAVFAVVFGLTVLIGFVKRVATVYTISDRRLNIKKGIIARKVQETRLGRVQNANFTQGFIERVLQVGDVEFTTAGTEESNFVFAGVAEPEDVVQKVDIATHAGSDPGIEEPQTGG
jgi:uncharacterized membrane protein YdbT with pleckstrin-like domain